MQLSWIAFTRGSEQPGAATPFVWRTVSASEPSPRDPQSRGACRGATSLRTRNAAVLPAAQRYGVSARGPVPGGEGKYDRRVLTQQQRQGLLASENGSCFCWKPHYSHRSVEGYRCCFLWTKVGFFMFFDKNSTKRPNCLVVRFVGNTMLRFGAKTRKKCENEQKTSFSVKTEKHVISCVLSKRREVLFNK